MSLPAPDPAASLALRALLAAILLQAGIQKLRDPRGFREAVAGYRLLPGGWVAPLAAALPGLEVLAGLALLLPGAASAGAAAAAALLALYAGAIAVNLARGRRDIDCGCGGPGGRQTLHGGLVARNAVLVGLAGLAALAPGARPLHPLDAASVAGAALAGLLLYAGVDLALANRARLREAGSAR